VLDRHPIVVAHRRNRQAESNYFSSGKSGGKSGSLTVPLCSRLFQFVYKPSSPLSSIAVLPRLIPVQIRPALHVGFELLAYVAACFVYLRQKRSRSDLIAEASRSTIICAAMIGAAVGGRLLAVAENPIQFSWKHLLLLDGGKTIIGAILGAWAAVEIVKRRTDISVRTGDLLVLPLLIGTVVGRIGCFLAGTADETFGHITVVPWGIDYGDGIRRHPLQLYEILILAAYYVLIERRQYPILVNGDRFRLYVFSYFGARFVLEFLKDAPRMLGLDVLQWAALAGMAWCLPTIYSILERQRTLLMRRTA